MRNFVFNKNSPSIVKVNKSKIYGEFDMDNILLKFMQFQNISRMVNNDEKWRKIMLRSIRPHMNEEKKRKIDMLIQCMDIQFLNCVMRG